MLPYFIVLLLSLLLMAIYQKTGKKRFLLLCALPLIALIGFRSAEVGTDTPGYCRRFLDMANYPLSLATLQEFTLEPGWNLLNMLLVRVSEHYYVLLTAVGTICTVTALVVIDKLSDAKVLSLLVYITLGFYLFAFAASRQAVAIAIYMCAIPSLVEGNFQKYAIVVLCAALFHQTALIALPLYFFFRMPFSGGVMILIIVGGLVTGAIIPRIMAFASTVEERYAVYTEYEGGGELFMVFYLALSLFFIVQRKYIIQEYQKNYDIMLNMLVFGSLIYVVVIASGLYGEVTRFAAYFQVSVMFLWAYTYKHRLSPIGNVPWIAILLGHIGYFYIYLSKIGDIIPYTFNLAFE